MTDELEPYPGQLIYSFVHDVDCPESRETAWPEERRRMGCERFDCEIIPMYADDWFRRLMDKADNRIRKMREKEPNGSMRQQAATSQLKVLEWLREHLPDDSQTSGGDTE